MGTVTVAQVITRCQNVLSDAGATRWPDAELIDWINDAQRAIATVQPEASSRVANVPLVAGTKQTLPVGAIALIGINRNMGVSGTAPGEAPRRTTAQLLDLHRPTWHTDTATLVVKNWMYDLRTPRVFYVYPPMSGATNVEAEYAIPPAAVTVVGDAISLDDFYVPVIVDYVLSRAFSKDIEIAGMAARASAHYNAFKDALAGTRAGEQAVSA